MEFKERDTLQLTRMSIRVVLPRRRHDIDKPNWARLSCLCRPFLFHSTESCVWKMLAAHGVSQSETRPTLRNLRSVPRYMIASTSMDSLYPLQRLDLEYLKKLG